MAKDFVPGKDSKLQQWLKDLKESIESHGPGVDLSPTDIANAQQLCDEYAAQIIKAAQARTIAKSEVAKKKSMRVTHLQPLRKFIRRMKAAPSYTTGTGKGMNVVGVVHELDAKTYSPFLKTKTTGELIEIKFKKRGIQGLEFWGKFNNGEWQKIGRRNHSPFYYKPEGYTPGTPLNCKFKAVAIIKDEYFGNWSGIYTVLYEQE
jgi:hypothetical protein